jgi:hypothetical protein
VRCYETCLNLSICHGRSRVYLDTTRISLISINDLILRLCFDCVTKTSFEQLYGEIGDVIKYRDRSKSSGYSSCSPYYVIIPDHIVLPTLLSYNNTFSSFMLLRMDKVTLETQESVFLLRQSTAWFNILTYNLLP